MSYALLFSGQGSQHAEMIPWLPRNELHERTASALGLSDVRDLRDRLGDIPWATTNLNAHVLLTGLHLAAWSELSPALPAPAAVAGNSIGELAAFCAAGVFSSETALDIAVRRARAMDRANIGPSGLLAVVGLPVSDVRSCGEPLGCTVALRYGTHNVVIGGPTSALEAMHAVLEAKGARCTRLRVGLASHTPLMLPAAEELRRDIAEIPFQIPAVPLFSNIGHRVRSPQAAKDALTAQLHSTVCWDQCMENVRERNVRCVLEVGPGNVLARLWNEYLPSVPARSCDDFRDAGGVIDWIRRHSN